MTTMKTAVRACIKANRLMQEYKDMMRVTKIEGLDPSTLIIFDNGYYTIISGSGKIYHVFCCNKMFGNYTGRFSMPSSPSDPDYNKSLLRIMPFDQAFTFLPKDVNERKFIVIFMKNSSTYN